MNWMEYIVVGLVIFFGLAVMYKALHEPIDWVMGWVRRGIEALRDKAANRTTGGYETIRYG